VPGRITVDEGVALFHDSYDAGSPKFFKNETEALYWLNGRQGSHKFPEGFFMIPCKWIWTNQQ
jgi:hypothetical protein